MVFLTCSTGMGAGIILDGRLYRGSRALAGDPKAQALVARAGEMLGRDIAMLCDVLNPELAVCGTLAVHLGDLYLEPAREALAPCPVAPAALCAALGGN